MANYPMLRLPLGNDPSYDTFPIFPNVYYFNIFIGIYLKKNNKNCIDVKMQFTHTELKLPFIYSHADSLRKPLQRKLQ